MFTQTLSFLYPLSLILTFLLDLQGLCGYFSPSVRESLVCQRKKSEGKSDVWPQTERGRRKELRMREVKSDNACLTVYVRTRV